MAPKEIIEQYFRPFRYNVVTNNYIKSEKIPVHRGCNGYIATNIGDTAVKINGQILFPSATPATVLGDSISQFGNKGEIYASQEIVIEFVQVVGPAPQVEITQKFYSVYEM